jgi:RNA 3'-terminal phosphate cyclase (ATP)
MVDIAGRRVESLGVRAKQVADGIVGRSQPYLQSSAPACRHLADQLLIPMALAEGGAFRTLELTEHTTTKVDVIQRS